MIEIVKEQREETESRYAGISELPTKYVGLGDVLKIGSQGHRPYPRPRDAKNCDGCSLKNHQKGAKYVPEPMAWKINGKNSGKNL